MSPLPGHALDGVNASAVFGTAADRYSEEDVVVK
jgi:hypothetical protein